MANKKLEIEDPKVNPVELENKANEDYEVKARDWLVSQGSDYGITNEMIGWNPETKSIMLNGDDFMKAGRLENGRSYVSNNDIRSAFDQYTKSRGLQSKSQKYDLGNFGYQPTQQSANPYANNDYSSKIDSILNEILNPTAFSYDPNSDASFQAYKEQYGRAGDKALANTMSEASAMTGGRLNSWAVSAGNQAKANYDQELMNVIPQLENMAYGRYQDGINSKRNNLNTLMDLDNEYFRRGMEIDNMNYGRALDGRDFAYGLDRDSISDARYTDETKYNRGRDALSDERYTDETKYNRNRDSISDTRYAEETAWNKKMDQDANSRAWANYNLSKDEFNYRKDQDQKEWDRRMKEAENADVEDPHELGVLYKGMKEAETDENNPISPEAWLMERADELTEKELEFLLKWSKEDTGNVYNMYLTPDK